MPNEFSNPGYIPPPPDGSAATYAVLEVADATARLALPQPSALGRTIKQLDDSSMWSLVPNGLAANPADWILMGNVDGVLYTPQVVSQARQKTARENINAIAIDDAFASGAGKVRHLVADEANPQVSISHRGIYSVSGDAGEDYTISISRDSSESVTSTEDGEFWISNDQTVNNVIVQVDSRYPAVETIFIPFPVVTIPPGQTYRIAISDFGILDPPVPPTFVCERLAKTSDIPTLPAQVGAQRSYMFDVRSFGAVGDGITDDTAAIQAAMDAAWGVGATVLIPQSGLTNGYYKITDALLIRGHGLRITGSSWNNEPNNTGRIKQATAGKAAFQLAIQTGGAVSTHGWGIESLCIFGVGAGISTEPGLDFWFDPVGSNFSDFGYFKNVWVSGFRIGARLSKFSNSEFINCLFFQLYDCVEIGGNCNAVNFIGCQFNTPTRACFHTTSSGFVNVIGCEAGNGPKLLLMDSGGIAIGMTLLFDKLAVESMSESSWVTNANSVHFITPRWLAGAYPAVTPVVVCNSGFVRIENDTMSGFNANVPVVIGSLSCQPQRVHFLNGGTISNPVEIRDVNTPTLSGNLVTSVALGTLMHQYGINTGVVNAQGGGVAPNVNNRGSVRSYFTPRDKVLISTREPDGSYVWADTNNNSLKNASAITGTSGSIPVGVVAGTLQPVDTKFNATDATLVERFVPAVGSCQLDDEFTVFATGVGGLKIKVNSAPSTIRFGDNITSSATGYLQISQGGSATLKNVSASGNAWVVTSWAGSVSIVTTSGAEALGDSGAIPGPIAFPSTTRPTTAGTGMPADTSLVSFLDVAMNPVKSWCVNAGQSTRPIGTTANTSIVGEAYLIVAAAANDVVAWNFSGATSPSSPLTVGGDARHKINFSRHHVICFQTMNWGELPAEGEIWFKAGGVFYNTNTVVQPTTKSFGVKIYRSAGTTYIALWYYNGTTFVIQAGTAFDTTLYHDIAINYKNGVLSGKLDGTDLPNSSVATGGPTGLSTTAEVCGIYGRNGASGGAFEFSGRNFRSISY